MAVMWPGAVDKKFAEVVQPNDSAKVLRVVDRPCAETVATRCERVTIKLTSGDSKGHLGLIQSTNDGIDPTLHVGDGIRVAESPEVPGYDYGDKLTAYDVTDFSRGGALLVLFGVFAVLVLVFSRLRGVFSILGLAVSLGVVLVFIVPAILGGKPPVLVAIVGSLAIAMVTIVLCHGRGPKAVAAMLGTIATLLLTAGLAALFTQTTKLTGLSSDELFALRLVDQNVSLTGLLIAGMVIGALGVLDDVTVSQSSTVFALRAANPALTYRELVKHAMEVGRDHVAATVNTLVLAYAGASLPVLLVFASGALSLPQSASLELVAEQIVGTLVGSIGLIAAVPLTTAIAAGLARSMDRDEVLTAAAHGHAHAH
ncbi:MAG TPA: YibE/F family protein [Conexibacter sp.]|jgi:uncharacterized membrane protein